MGETVEAQRARTVLAIVRRMCGVARGERVEDIVRAAKIFVAVLVAMSEDLPDA